MFLRRWRLSITSLFTLATLVPLVAVGIFLLVLSVRTVNTSSASLGKDILEESGRRVDSDIRQYLDQTVRMSDLLAGLVSDRMLATDGFEAWRERLFIRLRVTPEVSSICFTNENLDTIYLMRYPPELEFGEAKGHGNGAVLQTYAATADGTIRQLKKIYEYDPRTRPWWIAGHGSDHPVWTEPYEWFAQPERKGESVLAIAYTRSVRDRSGKRIGVLSIDATIDQINNHLAGIVRTDGAFIILTDLENRLVGSSFASRHKRLTPISELEASSQRIERDAAMVLQHTRTGDGSTLKIDAHNNSYWVKQSLLEIDNGPIWRITLAVPDSQLLRDAKSAVWWMNGVGTAFLIVAAVLAILLARSVTKPLRELAAFAREVGRGEFQKRLAPNSTREFDELSQTLNTMAANLQERVQILAAKDAAEEASAIKNRLIAHVSHEFRTPLNAIIGYGEMVREQAQAAGQTRADDDVKNILLASRHLLTLINNLLDLSRVEAGKMQLDFAEIEVSALVQEVTETLRPVLQSNGNRVETRGVREGEKIETDPARLRQILINLLGNAAKFTSDGCISLAVQLDGDVQFIIEDTGQGMSPEQVERLFEPFSQVQTPTRSPQTGAGLGLAISRQLTQLLGGTLEIQSERGRGTRAVLRLPRFHRDRGDDPIR